MDRVLFDLGFIEIRWYSICILLAIIVGYYFVIKEVKKKKIAEDEFNNLVFYTLIVGILGARIYYVLFNLNYYLNDPIEIIKIWNGGLAIHGGIIFGGLFLLIYSKIKKINTLLITDISVVGLIIAQAIGRWGNFFNGEAYGREVSLSFLKNLHLPEFIINGMHINNTYYEPTFLYESILCLIGFIVLIIIRKKVNIKTGVLTGIYFIYYGLIRFIIETFRSDSLMLGSFKVARIVSIIGIILGIYLIFRKNKLYKEDNL